MPTQNQVKNNPSPSPEVFPRSRRAKHGGFCGMCGVNRPPFLKSFETHGKLYGI